MIYRESISARWTQSVLCIAVSVCGVTRTARAQEAPPHTSVESAEREKDVDGPQSANNAGPAEAPVTITASGFDALKAEVARLRAEREADALVAQAQDIEAETAGTELLKTYGFMDFGVDKFFLDANGLALIRPTRATTFVFGNLNLYLDAMPTENLRALVELRFTLAPHGEETQLGPPLGSSYERINTTTFDFSSPSSQAQLRLGGIFIERAVGEYRFSELFRLEWGLFLNPFGIWNVDHGSPTLISLMLPTFISAEMIPTRLLGLNLRGSWLRGPSELGYSVHVSNGRTPLDFALTEDKGFGARLFYAYESNFGRVVWGASGYYGRYVDEEKKINPQGATSLANDNLYTDIRTIDYTEAVLGLDFALNLGGLRVRSEAVFRRVEYMGDKTEKVLTTDGSLLYLPRRLEWAAYALAAYRTPWRIEPYVELELATKSFVLPQWAGPARATSPNYSIVLLSGGFNIEVTTNLLVKMQVVWIRSYERDFTHLGVDDAALFGRVVLSF